MLAGPNDDTSVPRYTPEPVLIDARPVLPVVVWPHHLIAFHQCGLRYQMQ